LATGWKIEEKDTSDDRLARVVEELGKQEVLLLDREFIPWWAMDFAEDSYSSKLSNQTEITTTEGDIRIT
jgi:hypothetical protein